VGYDGAVGAVHSTEDVKGHARYTAGPWRHTTARVRGGMQERLCLVKVVVRQAADLTSRVKGVSGVCMVMGAVRVTEYRVVTPL
jgi:hypothetical protein